MPEWLAAPLFLFAGAIVSGLVSVLTGKLTSSTQKKTAEIETRGPEWQSFMTEVRQQNEDTKKELNGKIDRLQGKVARLEDGLKSVSAKYHKSLIQLVAWHRRHPDDPLVGSVPEELAHDMQYNYLSWQYPPPPPDPT